MEMQLDNKKLGFELLDAITKIEYTPVTFFKTGRKICMSRVRLCCFRSLPFLLHFIAGISGWQQHFMLPSTEVKNKVLSSFICSMCVSSFVIHIFYRYLCSIHYVLL